MIDGLSPANNVMLHLSYSIMFNILKSWLKNSLMGILLITIFLGINTATWTPPSHAALPSGNAITEGKALLRYALPIENKPVRRLQASLEDISTQLRANRRWGAISSDLKTASRILDRPNQILASVPEERQPQAEAWINQLKSGVDSLQAAVQLKDKQQVLEGRNKLLDVVTQLEESMVTAFPFEVPAEYSNLPQLKGRDRKSVV